MGKQRNRAALRTRKSVERSAKRTPGLRSKLTGFSFEDLERELSRRKAEATRLWERRRELLSELAEVEGELSRISVQFRGRRIVGTRMRVQKDVRVARGGRPRNALNLVESLRKALTGKTMSVAELVREVKSTGYKTTSPNFRTIVNQALLANRDVFKKVGRGVYTVA
ncbi:MAG TPA: hypothetical protein VG711_10700 [Phycisphaerales bacterium]|nr:hypothetical protein [Phycisphaerales bacterium]